MLICGLLACKLTPAPLSGNVVAAWTRLANGLCVAGLCPGCMCLGSVAATTVVGRFWRVSRLCMLCSMGFLGEYCHSVFRWLVGVHCVYPCLLTQGICLGDTLVWWVPGV